MIFQLQHKIDMQLSEPFVQKYRKTRSSEIIQGLRKRFVFKIYLRNISYKNIIFNLCYKSSFFLLFDLYFSFVKK